MQSDLQSIRDSHETSVELIKTETSKLQDEMAKIQQHLEEQLREAQYRWDGCRVFCLIFFTSEDWNRQDIKQRTNGPYVGTRDWRSK